MEEPRVGAAKSLEFPPVALQYMTLRGSVQVLVKMNLTPFRRDPSSNLQNTSWIRRCDAS